MGVVPSLVKSCAYAHHVLVGNHDLRLVIFHRRIQIPWAAREARIRPKAEPPRWLRYVCCCCLVGWLSVCNAFETRGMEEKRKGENEIARVRRDGPRDVDEENREPRA